MSFYRKDELGKVTRTAGPIVQRWNNRIFQTTHSVVGDADYYDIDPTANKYILELTDYTEFQLNFVEPNQTHNIFIRYAGKTLQLVMTTNEEIPIGSIYQRFNVYTLDTSTGLILINTPNINNYYEFETFETFPSAGKDTALYLAKKHNTALEGEPEKWEDYNMLFRYDLVTKSYIPVAGQGSGGGTGGAGITRLVASGILTFTHAVGAQLSLNFTYQNSSFTEATLVVFHNDVPKRTLNISTGPGTVDVTSLIQTGLNTFKLYATDAEGTASQIIYRVTGDTIALSSTFNDAKVILNQDVIVPYTITGAPTQRLMHFTLNGVETTEYALTNTENKVFSGLTHGVHELVMKVEGIFKDASGTELYRLTSNEVRLNIMYNDGVSQTILISSKYNKSTEVQGNIVPIDYVVYKPGYELAPVTLLVDGEIVNELQVTTIRQYWNLRTLPVGNHTLRILSGEVYVDKIVEITPTQYNIEVVKNSFLKLYLTAFGKTNADANHTTWLNSYGNPVNVTLNGFNYINNGWINDSLRLIGASNVVVEYKPFSTPIPSSGRTIELDFTTRATISDETVLISCFDETIGFVVKTQSVILKSSNTTTSTYFKEDEHVKIGFVINPVDKSIITYINGVISGVSYYTTSTSFLQSVPTNISLNPNGGSLDVFSIRVYDTALSAKNMLNNYMAEIIDVNQRIEKYLFNDVYDTYGNPSKDKMGALIPIMMIEGAPLPTAKMDVKPKVNVYFEHPYEPSKNFQRVGMKTTIDAQGTSSLAYPVKNFKIKFDKAEKYEIEAGWIPENVFTLKADYMDSSHANNMGLAKLFDTMYEVGIPPEQYDSRIRTTLYGYPMALFHRLTPQDPWVYKGVYNFNLDKDAETTVGLSNSKNYGTVEAPITFPLNQSFEVTFNQDSGAGAFQNNDIANVVASFEARYPGIDLEYDVNNSLIVTQEVTDCYANLQNLIQWVMDNNNLESFKTGFETRFDVESTLKYLIATEIFGLVDNLGKNMMLNTWDGIKWYPNFYDIDTALGLNNAGENIHNYDVEIGDIGVYATTESLLWKNIMTYFKTELKNYYSALRQGVFSYDNILKFLYEQQISKISEAQYNLDTYAKYISVTTAYLYMAQGKRLEFIRRWLTNRLALFDSKYTFSTYLSDQITLRMNIVGYQNAHVTLTPTITQYVGVRFGGVAELPVQVKTQGGVPAIVNGLETLGTGTITYMEVAIYGAKHLIDIGDISHLYPTLVSVESAKKLTKLIIGKQDVAYENSNLTEVRVGANTYLEEVDVTNCSNLGTVGEVLDLSQAENIKKVYAQGTQLKSITLPAGAPIEQLKLPATITELILKSHNNLMPLGLDITGYDNITTFITESVPNIDVIAEFSKTTNVQRLRMTGLNYSLFGLDYINNLIDKIWNSTTSSYKVYGIDVNGDEVITGPIISGDIKVLTTENISSIELGRMKQILPDLNITIYKTVDGLVLEDKGTYLNVTGYVGTSDYVNIPAYLNPLLNIGNPVILGTTGWVPIRNIGANTFQNKAFTEISLPNTIQSIGTNAFNGSSGFAIINIPLSVTTIGASAFNLNKAGVTIVVEAVTIPVTWDANWNTNADANVVLGGLPLKTFTFNVGAGAPVVNIIAPYLTEAMMPESYLYGYSMNGWKDSTNTSITYPYIPDALSPDIIELTLSWTKWVYTVNYRLPDNSIHYTQTIEYQTPLGQEFIDIDDGGVDEPVYSGQVFKGWIDTNETTITSETVITQDISTKGSVVDFYSKWLDTLGLVFEYNATYDVYDVTAWSPSSSISPRLDCSVDLFVPGTYNDKPVRHVKIDNVNDSYRNKIRSITIEQSSRTDRRIEDGTGYSSNFAKMKTLIIPSGFVYIGASAYTGCTSLINVTLPNTITTIGYAAFSNCTSLVSITIPSGVSTLNTTFQGCASLTSITIPSTITTMSGGVFGYCSSLVNVTFEGTNLPYTLFNAGQFVGTKAVFSIPFLQNSIKLTVDNKGVMDLSETVLYCYPAASGVVNLGIALPSTINNLNMYAFKGNGLLTSITIPSNITTIGTQVFSGCTSLTEVILPSTITVLETNLFYGCISLTSITIPNSVTTMRSSVFSECTSLVSVTMSSNITAMESSIFYNCSSLTSVTIPAGITTLPTQAFCKCSSLTSIIIPSTITIIGDNVFQYCSALTSITIPDSVTTMGLNAFQYCSALTTVVLSANLSKISAYSFHECTVLNSVTLGTNLVIIETFAFSKCYALATITIPSNVNFIGASTFYNCPLLESVVLQPTTPPTVSTNSFTTNKAGRKFYVPVAVLSAYQTATNWTTYASAMEGV